MLFSHNQETYDKVCEEYKLHNNLILIQGTGVGKSFVAIELIQKMFPSDRVLFVCPKKAIENGIRRYREFGEISDRVDFAYNAYFTSESYVNDMFSKYDMFIVDEAHHMGAELTGKNLVRLLNLVKNDTTGTKHFLALTATPYRESDKMNVVSLFDSAVSGLTTIQCIDSGLMPKVEYLVCTPARELTAEEKEVYRERLSIKDSDVLLRDIISKNPKKKWLCYYSSINEMKANHDTIQSLFPDYRIITISSDAINSQNEINNIGDDEKVVIESVDMLLEGVHLPNMQGILLFRNVTTLSVFTQIFGRITAIGAKEVPLFVDCTSSAYTMLRKLLAASEVGEGDTEKESTVKKSKNILHISLQNKELFDINCLLMEMSDYGKTFEYRGTVYPSFCATLKAFGISYSTYYRLQKQAYTNDKHKLLDYILEEVIPSKSIVYRGKTYSSLLEVCNEYGLNAKAVSTYRCKHNCTVEAALDAIINKAALPALMYEGKTFGTVKEFCKHCNIPYEPFCAFYRKNSFDNLSAALEAFKIRSPYSFTYNGILYTSKNEACKQLGLDAQKVAKYSLRHSCSTEEAISFLLTSGVRDNTVVCNGITYPSFKQACRELGINYIHAIKRRSALKSSNDNELLNLLVAEAAQKKDCTIVVNGQSFENLAEASLAFGIPVETVKSYMYSHKCNSEEALNSIIRNRAKKTITIHGTTYPNLAVAAQAYGITSALVRSYANYHHVSKEQALLHYAQTARRD